MLFRIESTTLYVYSGDNSDGYWVAVANFSALFSRKSYQKTDQFGGGAYLRPFSLFSIPNWCLFSFSFRIAFNSTTRKTSRNERSNRRLHDSWGISSYARRPSPGMQVSSISPDRARRFFSGNGNYFSFCNVLPLYFSPGNCETDLKTSSPQCFSLFDKLWNKLSLYLLCVDQYTNLSSCFAIFFIVTLRSVLHCK